MPRWLALNPTDHASAAWFRYRDYGFAARDGFAPVAMAELTRILPYYPMAFIPAQDSEDTDAKRRGGHLVALLSLQLGRNVYLSADNTWQAPYIPSHFRGYPFALASDGQLCIDTESGLFHPIPQPGAVPVFADGVLSEGAGKIHTFHQERAKALAQTQKLVAQLYQADLVQPWDITWKPREKIQTMRGYFRIDEARLRALPPETYADLAHTGALGLAYAQLFSQARLADLRFRHSRLLEQGQSIEGQKYQQEVERGDIIESMFGQDDDFDIDLDRF